MSHRSNIVLCSVLCLSALLPLFGGTQPFRFHGITDDLPSLSISSIAQDSRGFLWFGTQAGLVMFDGDEYITHTSVPFAENTLSSNLVQTMMMDDDDVLWVGTYAGLDRYDIPTGLFTHFSVGSDVVVSILKDSSGRIWAGTLDGLGCLAPGSAIPAMYRKENADRFIGNNTVRNLYEDTAGRIFACTYDGLWEYDAKADSFVPSSLLLPGNPAEKGTVYDIRQDSSGDYWVARWGVGFIRIRAATREYTVFPLEDNRIYCMNATFDPNLVLAGTWGGGLNVLDKRTGEVTSYTQRSVSGQSLTNDIVYSMFFDRSGLLWLGTNGGGINLYDPSHSWFSSLEAELDGDRLPTGKINGILVDDTGDYWIAVTNRGITRYSPKTSAYRHYGSNPSIGGTALPDSVYCLYRDSRGRMYAGTERGPFLYEPSTDTFQLLKWTSSIERIDGILKTSCIAVTSDGSTWIGTWEDGLYRYIPSAGKYVQYKNDPADNRSISDNLIYFVGEDRTGKLWIGTNRGLNRFNPATGDFTCFYYDRTNLDGISSNTIYSMYEHTDGTIWFGTRNGGVCTWHPDTGRFTHLTSSDGLPSDTIVGISPSRDGFLWFATQNGLVRYDTVRQTVFIYRTSDGLLSQQFNSSFFRPDDDRRFFGTPQGLVWFSEKDVVEDTSSVPGVAVTSVMINNQRIPVPYTNGTVLNFTLQSDQRNINIGYTPLDFSPLARYTCSYILEGFDNEWIQAGDRDYAMYTNLNPGKYLFRIHVNARHGQEAPRDTLVSFVIVKPVPLRWYAILLYIVIFLVTGYMIHRIRQSLVLEQKVGELEATKTSLQSVNMHLEELSYHDPLTGIPNRRYFEYVIAREWDAALLCKDFISVLMIDIDFFKMYNDTFGHMEGDRALRIVANALNSALFRVSDVVSRYGGEEFVIILPDTNAENAQTICNRLMSAIDKCQIPFDSVIANHLTISIGCYTGIPSDGITYEKFILRADKALYQAKNDGRNRYLIYTYEDFEV